MLQVDSLRSPDAPSLENGDLVTSLFSRWLNHWRIIVLGGVVGCLLGLVAIWVIAPRYTATLILLPASNGLQAAPSSALSGFASTLSDFGVQLPQSSSQSDFILFPRVIRTSEVASQILNHRDLVKRLFPREYDPAMDKFHAPSSILQMLKALGRGLVNEPAYIPPTAQRIQDYINENVKVTEATTTSPVVTLSYSNRDPSFARSFLLFIYQVTDAQLRTWRVTRAQETSTYLENKLNNVSAVDYRAGLLNQLIPQQMTVMVSNPHSPFSARILDGPVTPDIPDLPPRFLFLFGGFLAGLAVVMALLAISVLMPDILSRLPWKA